MAPVRRRRSARGARGAGSTIRFPCPGCGRPLRRAAPPAGSGRHGPLEIRCPSCRFLMFDYPRPCAGVVVVRGSTVLVIRRGHPPKRGWLDTPGGFIDAGESIDHAARRELFEETGLRVGRMESLGFYWDRYYLRGFGWFPTMNFYYLAHWRSGTPQASDDAASVEWMPLARVGRGAARLAWPHMTELMRDVRRRMRGV